MHFDGRRLFVVALLCFVAFDTYICQVTPAGRTRSGQQRQLANAAFRRQRRLERDIAVIKNQVATLEYRLTLRLTAVLSERVQEIVSQETANKTQIERVVERLSNVEDEVQALKDKQDVADGDLIAKPGGDKDASVINDVNSKLTSLEKSIEILNSTVVEYTSQKRNGSEGKEPTSTQCLKCEQSIDDLRTEIATNLTKVQSLIARTKTARTPVGQQIIPVKSRRSNSQTTEAPFEYATSDDVESNVIQFDDYDGNAIHFEDYDVYGDDDNTTLDEYNTLTEDIPDLTGQRKKPTGNRVSNLLTQEMKEIIDGLYIRLRSQKSLMESLFEMYANNSKILDGFENRFATIRNAFDRADTKDAELSGGIRSNRKMLEAFAVSFREIVQDGRRQTSAIVNLRKRIRLIEGTAPKSFARKSDLQSIRVFVNRTISRLYKTKGDKIQGAVVSNEPIKRLLNAAIDSLNYTIIQNQVALKRMEILPTTVQFLESELSSYSSDIESIPQLREDVEGVVSMKNLVLRNAADLTKIHDSVSTNEVSLVDFFSRLNDLGIDLQELQQEMMHVQMENSALRSGIGRLNSSALDTEYRLSYFKNIVSHNISRVYHEIEQLSSETEATENKVQNVDDALTNLKRETEDQERSFEIHKATLNTTLHNIDNRISQCDRSLVLMSSELSKSAMKINDQVASSVNRYEQNKDSIKDIINEVADVKSTFERAREEDFTAAAKRNEMASKIDVLTANIRNHDTSLEALQRGLEQIGANFIDSDSRINTLENTASRFIEFEEVTDRRFRTQLNATKQVRQQLLEQISKLQTIDVKMNQLIHSVKTAQNNIIGQREEFQALLDRSTNQSVSLQRLSQKLRNDVAGSNVTRELYRKINELQHMIGNVKNEINVFSAKENAQKERFDGIEKDVSTLQSSSWEQRNKISDQDNLLGRLKSDMNQTKVKERSLDLNLRNSEGLLQQMKQRTERNELDLTELRGWRDEMDYAVYFLDKISISLSNSSRDSVVANRLLAKRVTELESQGQSSSIQIDTVKRIVDSNAEGLVQQYSQINKLVKKDVELDTLLKKIELKTANIEGLQSELTTVGDRTSEMSTLVSKQDKQIANLLASTKFIHHEVNSTVNRLNLLVVTTHEERARLFTQQNEIVRDAGEMKQRISRINSTGVSNQAALWRLEDDLSSSKVKLGNISSSVAEIGSVMGASADLRQVNTTLRLLLKNMSHTVNENSKKVKALDETAAKISDGVKSVEKIGLTHDVLLDNLTSTIQAQGDQLVQLQMRQNSSKTGLQAVNDDLDDAKVQISSLENDILTVTKQWIQSLRTETLSADDTIHRSIIDMQDKINSTSMNLSITIETLADNSLKLMSALEDNVTQVRYAVDRKLIEGLREISDEQHGLSGRINKSNSAIVDLVSQYQFLDQMRLEMLKKAKQSTILESEIMKMMSNQTEAEEHEFLRQHASENASLEDLDVSIKLAARLAMIAKNFNSDMDRVKSSLTMEKMETENDLDAINTQIAVLSKNVFVCEDKIANNSADLEKALQSYANLSLEQDIMRTESVDLTMKLDNVSREFKNIVSSLTQDLAHLEHSVQQGKEENELQINKTSYYMMRNLNETIRELMDLITENENSFEALNESLQLKISALEVSNVHKQLDLKLVDLNNTVHLLSDYLQDYSSQFAAIARYIEQMKNSSDGLPTANAMRCRENSPFAHLCERKYVDSVGKDMNFVRYRDLFEHIFNETERVKDVPSRVMTLLEKSVGMDKRQHNLESTFSNYTKEIGSNISHLANEAAAMDRRLQISVEDHKNTILDLERRINSTNHGLQDCTEAVINVKDAVEELKTLPNAIRNVREEMTEEFEKVNAQINRTADTSRVELEILKVEATTMTGKVVSHAEDILRAFDANVTHRMKILGDMVTSEHIMMSSQISSHGEDIESLVTFRVELSRALKNIRDAFKPLESKTMANRTLYNDSRNERLNASLNSVVAHFTQTLLSHLNGTNKELGVLMNALQKTNRKTEHHRVILDKLTNRSEYFNGSLITNRDDIGRLMQQIAWQDKKAEDLFETTIAKLNVTARNMRQRINSDQLRFDEVESKLDLNYKKTNVSITALFENVGRLGREIEGSARETRALILHEQNVSAIRSVLVERTCDQKIIQLKDALAKISENNAEAQGRLERTESSISVLNSSMATAVQDTKRKFDVVSNQTRFQEMELVRLTESIKNASDIQSNAIARFGSTENIVRSLSSKQADNTLSIRRMNESLKSASTATQKQQILMQELASNLSSLHSEMRDSLQTSMSNNDKLIEISKSMSLLWDESDLLKSQQRNHSNKIELLQDLEEQSSKYAGTLLDMITAFRMKYDNHQSSISRHWNEMQQQKSLLDNITSRLSDEINNGNTRFFALSREIFDAKNTSASLWWRFERINSTVGEFREDNEMLIDQMDNLTSILEKLVEDNNNTTNQISLSEKERRNFQVLNESLTHLQASLQNLSEPAEGSGLIMESSGLEMFNDSIQNQMQSLMRLVDGMRSSMDYNLREISDNTSEVIRSVSRHILDHFATSYLRNCTSDVDNEKFMSIMQRQNRSIQSLSSKLDELEVKLTDNTEIASEFNEFKKNSSARLSEIAQEVELIDNSSIAMTFTIQRFVSDSEMMNATIAKISEDFDRQLTKLKKETSNLHLKSVNDSMLTSSALKGLDKMKNHTVQTEMKSHNSANEISVYKDDIANLSKLLDIVSRNFASRLDSVENIFNTTQQDVVNRFQTLDITIKLLENDTSLIKTDLNGTMASMKSLSIQMDDSDLQRQNLTEILFSKIHICEDGLQNLSEFTLTAERKANLSGDKIRELERIMQVMTKNSSRDVGIREKMQHSMQDIYSNQLTLKSGVSKLGNYFTNLSDMIGRNDEFYEKQFAKIQERCQNLEKEIENETKSMHDNLLKQEVEIEKLQVEDEDIRKRLSDDQLDLELSITNIKDSFIKSQAQDAEKFLTIIKMLTDVANDTDSCTADIRQLRNMVEANRMNFAVARSKMESLSNNISQLHETQEADFEWTKYEIKFSQKSAQQINSALRLFGKDYLNDKFLIERKFSTLVRNVTENTLTLHNQSHRMDDLLELGQHNEKKIDIRFRTLDNSTSLQNMQLIDRASNLENSFRDFVKRNKENQTLLETLMNENSERLEFLLKNSTEVAKSITSLDKMVVDNIVEIRSLRTSKSELEKKTNGCLLTQNELSERLKALLSDISVRFNIIHSNIRTNAYNIDRIVSKADNQSKVLDFFKTKIATLVKQFDETETNLTNWILAVKQLEVEFYLIDRRLKGHETKMTVLESIISDASNKISALFGRQDDLRSNQSSVWEALGKNEQFLQELEDFRVSANDSLSRISKLVQDSQATISAQGQQMQEDSLLLNNLANKSPLWDLTSEGLASAKDDLKRIQEDAERQNLLLQEQNARLQDVADGANISKAVQDNFSWIISTIQHDVGRLQNTTSQFIASSNKQVSLMKSQVEENMMTKSMVALMKEQLHNLTRDDINLEEEIFNASNAILILARRVTNQSSAIQLLSEQTDLQQGHMKARLDNVSLALMSLDDQNDIRSSEVQSLENSYRNLLQKAINNSIAIGENENKNIQTGCLLKKLQNSIATVIQNLSNSDVRMNELDVKIDKQSVDYIDSQFTNWTQDVVDSMQRNISMNYDEFQILSDKTRRIGQNQEELDGKLLNLTHRLDSNFIDMSDNAIQQQEELVELRQLVHDVTMDVASVEFNTQNLTLHMNVISANMSRAIVESQSNLKSSLRAAQTKVLENITANAFKIQALGEERREVDEIQQKSLLNLTLRIQTLNETFLLESTNQRSAIDVLHGSTRSNAEKLNDTYFNVSQDFLAFTEDSHNRYRKIAELTQAITNKQDSMQSLIVTEQDELISLTKSLQNVYGRLEHNEAGLLNMSQHVDHVEAASRNRLDWQENNLEFLHNLIAEKEDDLTKTEMYLQDFFKTYEHFELKTASAINNTQSEATRMIASLERSLKDGLAVQSNRLDNLMDISESMESNQSLHKQEISSLVSDLKSLGVDLNRLTKRQRYQDDAIIVLGSVHNETELQVELLSNQVLKLHERSNRHEQNIEKQHQNMTRLKSLVHTVSSRMEIHEDTLSAHGESMEKWHLQLNHVANVTNDLKIDFEGQRLFAVGVADRLNYTDRLLLQMVDNFTEFVVSSNSKSAESEELMNRMQLEITRMDNSSRKNSFAIKILTEDISASKPNIQDLKDAISMCSDRLNASALEMANVIDSFSNLSSGQDSLRKQVAANLIELRRHSGAIAQSNRSQNALFATMLYINGSVVSLADSVHHLNGMYRLRYNAIDNLQQQQNNVSSLVNQLTAFSNQTQMALNRVNKITKDNRFGLELLGRNITEIGGKSMQEMELLASKGKDLEILINLINNTMHQSYSEIDSRQDKVTRAVERNSNKAMECSTNFDHLQVMVQALSENVTGVVKQREVDATKATETYSQFDRDLLQIKNEISSNTENIAEASLILEVVQGDLMNYKEQQLEESHHFNASVTDIRALVSNLDVISKEHSSQLDIASVLQDQLSTNMNTIGKTVFDFYNQTARLSKTSEQYARTMKEQNHERERTRAELGDMQTKVEMLMKYNLINLTLDDNNSSILSFADILTQLRKDVTQLNVTAWNAISKTNQDLPIDYGGYDDDSDDGSVDKSVYFDFSSSESDIETPYLLSNMTTVFQGIEKILYFIVPNTRDVLYELRSSQDSVNESFGNFTSDVHQLQETVDQHFVTFLQYRNWLEKEITLLSSGINVTDDTLRKMNRSVDKTNRRFDDKVKEIDIDIRDGSRRLTTLERILPFMESKQQNTIDMFWQVNETVSNLKKMQQLKDVRFDLVYNDFLEIRKDMEETISKMSKTEESFVEFSNTSNRYRISLWKDVLDIVNSTMEKVDTRSEVLLRGGERRDMLLVNADKSIRRISSDVAELQKTTQDTDLETKWNGNQIDTCLQNVEDLNTDINNRLQDLETKVRNQTVAVNGIKNRLNSVPVVISKAAPNAEVEQTTQQPTTLSQMEMVASPTNLQVFNVDATSILLSWNASTTAGVTGYRAVLLNAFNEDEPPIQLQVQDVQAIFERLQPDTPYTVELYAQKDNLLSEPLSGIAITSSEQSPIFNDTSTPSPTTGPVSDIIWQCNFEHECEIYQTSTDDFDWEYNNGSTGSDETGPMNDHTVGDSNGRYFYIEASNPRQSGDVAKMATSLLEAVEDGCLEFFYHMYGTGTGDLSVWLDMENHKREKVWEMSGSQGNIWKKETQQIQTDQRFRLVFEGVRGSDFHSDIAIDDIIIKRGRCPSPLFVCDFEDPSSCGFVQDDTDDFDWERIKGATPSSDTGPLTDHTLMTSEGYYMYMESSRPRLDNEKTRLITPEIWTTDNNCLQFFYHMHGIDINKLSVYIIKSLPKAHDELIWSKSGSQGNDWNSARVNIAAQNRFRIIFEATVGADYHGDIGLDDVQILPGSCDSPVCSLGERFGDFCYVINETPRVYVDAQIACQEHDGNLATIKTKEQQDFIKGLVSNNTKPLDKFWIGLDDLVREGHFVYSDKTPLVQSRNSFNAWAVGEPNDVDGSEDCVAIDNAYKRRRWSDLPCFTAIGYICQYPSLI